MGHVTLRRVAVGLTSVVAAGLTSALAACGGHASTRRPPSAEFAASPLIDHEGRVDALSGTWAQLQVSTAESQSTLAGTVVSTNERILLVELEQSDEGAISASARVCSVDIETSTGMADTEVPEAFVTSIAPLVWTGALVHGPEGPGVVFDRSWEALGMEDSDPSAELPDSVDDPRVTDTDGDGHPGVTIRVTGLAGGEMYFAQRSWREYESLSLDGVTFDGVIRWGGQRVVLDATSRMLRNARDSVATESPADNWFRTTRVLPGTTCEEVVDARDVLFAR